MPLQKSPQDVTREKKEELLIQGTGRVGSDVTTLLGGPLYSWNRPATNVISRIAGLVRNSLPPNANLLARLNAFSWRLTTPNNALSPGVSCSGDGRYLIATAGATVFYISADGGTTWTTKSLSGNPTILASRLSYDGRVQILRTNGNVVGVSENYGTTWTSTSMPATLNDVCVSGDGTTLFAVYSTSASTSFTFSMKIGSGSWTPQTPVTMGRAGTANGSAFSYDGTKAIVTTTVGLVTYDGTSWTYESAKPVSQSPAYNLVGCAMSYDGNIRAVCSGTTTFTYISTNGGTDWTQLSSITGASRLAMSSDGSVLYASMSNNTFLMSLDLGLTWTPITPASGRSYTTFIATTGDGRTVIVGSGTVPRTLFIGTTTFGRVIIN